MDSLPDWIKTDVIAVHMCCLDCKNPRSRREDRPCRIFKAHNSRYIVIKWSSPTGFKMGAVTAKVLRKPNEEEMALASKIPVMKERKGRHEQKSQL